MGNVIPWQRGAGARRGLYSNARTHARASRQRSRVRWIIVCAIAAIGGYTAYELFTSPWPLTTTLRRGRRGRLDRALPDAARPRREPRPSRTQERWRYLRNGQVLCRWLVYAPHARRSLERPDCSVRLFRVRRAPAQPRLRRAAASSADASQRQRRSSEPRRHQFVRGIKRSSKNQSFLGRRPSF